MAEEEPRRDDRDDDRRHENRRPYVRVAFAKVAGGYHAREQGGFAHRAVGTGSSRLDFFGLDSPFDILGLYRGVALPLKSVSDPRPNIDMIFLYRRPILDYWCDTGEPLQTIVRHVLIHEIGHHFGFSDDDMERIEAEG